MKILIVEDEPSLREIMVRTLTREQYVVEQAADYAAALDKIAAYDYDCILLDIMLPGGSGLREQGQIFLVVAGGYHKKGAVHPGGIQGRENIRRGLAGAIIKGQTNPLFRQGGIGLRFRCGHRGHSRGEGCCIRPDGQIRLCADSRTARRKTHSGRKSSCHTRKETRPQKHPPQTWYRQTHAKTSLARCFWIFVGSIKI